MNAATLMAGKRVGLDALVRRMLDPCFVMLHRRVPKAATASGHVNPSLLQLMPPRSRFVRKWRRHAERCPQCAIVFRSLGLQINPRRGDRPSPRR